MSETKKGEKKNRGILEGILDMGASSIECIGDIAKTNLRDKPVLSLGAICLILIIVIALPAILLFGLDEKILYLMALLLPVMVFVVIISIISIKSTPATTEHDPDHDKIKILNPNESQKTWKEIYGAFKGTFYSFNAPFELEKDYREDQRQNTYKVISDLYDDSDFNVKYLYFTGKNDEEKRQCKDWITNLKKYLSNIKTARLGDNYRVYIVKDERIPDSTFFVGKKNKKDCSILYPFRQKSGSYRGDAIVVYDERFARSLMAIFNEAMEKAKAQNGEIKTEEELKRKINEI